MKILKNYINREWFSVFFLSLMVISFVLVLGNIFRLVQMVIAKNVDIRTVLELFVYLLPRLLIYSIPISTLTATLLSFGQLSYDNEITAIRASGISLYPILANLMLLGVFFAVVCLYFNDSLIPKAHFKSRKILYNIGIKRPTAYLEEKTFIKAFKGYIIFIYKIRGSYLEDVRIYQPAKGAPTRTIIAKRGEFLYIPDKHIIKLMLHDGTADEPDFKNPEMFYKLNFQNYQLTLRLKQEEESASDLDKKVQDMTIDDLNKEIDKMKALHIDYRPLLVGLYRKYALSLSSLILMLIALPLALRIRAREKSLGFGLSLVICLLYYLVMAFGESLALSNKIPPFLGEWLANFVFLLLGIFLTAKVIEE